MVLDKLADTAESYKTAKNKMGSILMIIIGVIAIIFGIFIGIASGNLMFGVIATIIGIGLILLGFWTYKRARKHAQIQTRGLREVSKRL
jgi:uncharacterized membrane protein HdeD (DUF308 family)